MKYFETSAKTSFNLFEIFKSLASDLLFFNDMSKVRVLIAYKKVMILNKFRKIDFIKINIYNSKAQSFVYEYNLPNEIKINENKKQFDQKRRVNWAIKKRKKQLPGQPIIKFKAGIKPKQDNINLKTETMKSLKDSKYSNCCTI
jgi:hypothetical protein